MFYLIARRLKTNSFHSLSSLSPFRVLFRLVDPMQSTWLPPLSLITFLLILLSISTQLFGQRCTYVKQREEWRTLSRAKQISYINAVKCLMSRRSQLSPLSRLSYNDDFQTVHSTLQGSVHFVAHFLVCKCISRLRAQDAELIDGMF